MRRHLLPLAAALFAFCPVRAEPPKAGGADLVPSTAFGFVTVRASDVRQIEALKPLWDALAKVEKSQGALTRTFGVTLDEVDRVTLFWPALPADGPDPSPVVVVTTREPFN
ncbi:MAG: hypothetical protein J2P46_16755, partial [Zavarzinella sp.]|nr:hypothetical protein [Zavarzinella sp.]